jgi:hypothetical protein
MGRGSFADVVVADGVGRGFIGGCRKIHAFILRVTYSQQPVVLSLRIAALAVEGRGAAGYLIWFGDVEIFRACEIRVLLIFC